ncbi:MAG: hypothetical protein Q8K92_05535 [Leadbetterella sp.]|nr:hypothetical protein [Leadbetterella sp.]
MSTLKKVNIVFLIAIKIYLVVPLILEYPKITLITSSIIVFGFIINLVKSTIYLPKVRNAAIFYQKIDFKNDPEYDDFYEDEELGELLHVFSIEYVNPKIVNVSKVILPFNRINIIIDNLVDEPVKYVIESSDGFNSETLDSEIEEAKKLFEDKNHNNLYYFRAGYIHVFRGKNGIINLKLEFEEI